MGKKKRLSRDQKRKNRLAAKRKKQQSSQSSLVYSGNKYKKEKYIPVLHRTEVSIYEAFVMLDRQLTDREVESALIELMKQLRTGWPAEPESGSTLSQTEADNFQFLEWNICRNWNDLFRTEARPKRKEMIGILGTILSSIEVWKKPSPNSQGYLKYIEGFLRETGVTVEKVPDFEEVQPRTAELELALIGREVYEEDNPQAGDDFRDFAQFLIQNSDVELVVDVCRQLSEEYVGQPIPQEISEIWEISQGSQKKLIESE